MSGGWVGASYWLVLCADGSAARVEQARVAAAALGMGWQIARAATVYSYTPIAETKTRGVVNPPIRAPRCP
eukprot:2572799-Pyramimonas_sp.AAC.1